MAAAQRIASNSLGIAGEIFPLSDDIAGLASAVDRYGCLVGQTIVPRLSRRQNKVWLTWPKAIREHALLRSRNDGGVFSVLRLLESYLGVPCPPLAIYFAHAKPRNRIAYDEHFDCPVFFGCESIEIALPLEVWTHSFPQKNVDARARLSLEADALVGREVPRCPEEVRVRLLITDRLRYSVDNPKALRDEVHDTLGRSRRSLQRDLSDDTCWNQLVEETRADLARLYLDADLPLSDIPAKLGYSGLPAFYRAFKRWYGQTPADYRSRPKVGAK